MSNTSDVLASQKVVIDGQSKNVDDAKSLAETAAKAGYTGAQLLKAQADIDDKKRTIESLKEMNGTLKDIQNTLVKKPTPN